MNALASMLFPSHLSSIHPRDSADIDIRVAATNASEQWADARRLISFLSGALAMRSFFFFLFYAVHLLNPCTMAHRRFSHLGIPVRSRTAYSSLIDQYANIIVHQTISRSSVCAWPTARMSDLGTFTRVFPLSHAASLLSRVEI